jgi:hypothetical protein
MLLGLTEVARVVSALAGRKTFGRHEFGRPPLPQRLFDERVRASDTYIPPSLSWRACVEYSAVRAEACVSLYLSLVRALSLWIWLSRSRSLSLSLALALALSLSLSLSLFRGTNSSTLAHRVGCSVWGLWG